MVRATGGSMSGTRAQRKWRRRAARVSPFPILEHRPMEFAATVVILTCTYALLAAGIVILYKAGRVVNFAHGELAIVGGYVFYSSGLLVEDNSLVLAILGAVVFSVVMGSAIYMAMMRRLVGEPFYVAILVTI